MRTLTLIVIFIAFTYFEATAQTKFVLEPFQSMIMTGKGPGQDATINPYFGQDCYAIVKNIGKRAFSIRVQQEGTIIEEIPIAKGESKRVKLLKNYKLYLDPNPQGIAKASVSYEKISE